MGYCIVPLLSPKETSGIETSFFSNIILVQGFFKCPLQNPGLVYVFSITNKRTPSQVSSHSILLFMRLHFLACRRILFDRLFLVLLQRRRHSLVNTNNLVDFANKTGECQNFRNSYPVFMGNVTNWMMKGYWNQFPQVWSFNADRYSTVSVTIVIIVAVCVIGKKTVMLLADSWSGNWPNKSFFFLYRTFNASHY